MATIQTRTDSAGKKSYRVQIRLKGHPPETATFHRLTDAKNWAQQTEADIRAGRHSKTHEARRHTVGEAIDRYSREIMPHKPRSIRQQASQLQWWKDKLGTLTLADCTAARIVEARGDLLREVSASTANRYMAVFGHMLGVCVKEWQWLEDSPMTKIRRLNEPAGIVRYLDKKTELPALLKACRESGNPHLYGAVLLALSTGARKNEILTLRWRNVDFDRGQFFVEHTKNRERRALPLTGPALAWMQERARVRYLHSDYVFCQTTQDKPVDIDRDFARARDAANIKNFRFHDLRHTAASFLAMNGASTAEIAAVLGHKTLSMVKRYAHLSDAHTAGVVTRMNAALFDATESEADHG